MKFVEYGAWRYSTAADNQVIQNKITKKQECGKKGRRKRMREIET